MVKQINFKDLEFTKVYCGEKTTYLIDCKSTFYY